MLPHVDEIFKVLRHKRRSFARTTMDKVSETNPYRVLISCLLSLRSRDEITEKVSEKLFAKAKTPKRIANMPLRDLERIIHSINYYKTKARRIRDISKEIVRKGYVPNTMEELLKFKGVGPKTANIVLVYGFRKEGLPIDTHCHRIPNRLGWVHTKTPEQTEKALRATLPKKYWNDFNDLFVQFGQNICKPIGPKCGTCPINKYCDYYNNKGVSHKCKTNS
jgi:endonuclease III